MSDSLRKSVSRASGIYERLLWLYPRVHRLEYGPLMSQLFRDQCRALSQDEHRWGVPGLILRVMPDLARSAFHEHLTERTAQMKNISPQKLSLVLFIAAIGAALSSCSFILNQTGIALGLAYFSAATLLTRAFAECKRPGDEWVRSLIWGAVIAVIYALIFPVWAKLKLPVIAWLVAVPMLLNGIVPLFKSALRLSRPRL